jgi:amidophosphoribosyltransferase
MTEFCAFLAAIELLKETHRENLIENVYHKCKAQQKLPSEQLLNHVKDIYAPFTTEQISQKIAEILRPSDIKAEVAIVYQSIEGLHAACPNNQGDWYFSGNYPTPGGNRVVNNAFIDYYEKGI